MSIEKLLVLPNHIKGEDGYYYDEKYVGKLFHYKDKLLYFNEKSYIELPYILYSELNESIQKQNEFLTKSIEEIKNSINEIKESFNSEIENIKNNNNFNSEIEIIKDAIRHNSKNITDILVNQNDFDSDILNIKKIIDDLKNNINNFKVNNNENVVTKEELNNKLTILINDINTNLKTIVDELNKLKSFVNVDFSTDNKKLSLNTLKILRDMNLTPTEIKELIDYGLI